MSHYRFPKDKDDALLTLTREDHPSSPNSPPTPIWVIELHNGADNRLSHALIDDCLKPALDTVEREWREIWRAAEARRADAKKQKKPEDVSQMDGSGALIIIGRRSQDKFFSNGLDYVNAIADPNFFTHTLNPFLARLLTFPIPVIAALNGHTFAAGLMLALSCDYRIMTDGSTRNAWACMNEVHFGAPWPPSFAAITNAKVASPLTIRRLALEGTRFTPQDCLEHGIVDEIVSGGTLRVFDAAKNLAVKVAPGAKTGVYGLIKFDLMRDTLKAVAKDYRQIFPRADDAVARVRLSRL